MKTVSQSAPPASDTMRTRSFSTYSVTSSSVDASRPIIMRVSRKRAPTPDFTSDRNSTRRMPGTACENCSTCATVRNTTSAGASIRRVTVTFAITSPASRPYGSA